MLESTFLHFRGVGPVLEAELWSRGFANWDDLLDSGSRDRLARTLASQARSSRRRLAARDAAHFQAALPSSHRWRLYDDFLTDAAFLDIETTGLSPEYSVTTMVGILDRHGYAAYVRGDNLDGLPDVLRRYRLFVTFNGSAFDIPFLASDFGVARDELFGHAAHIDLRYLLGSIGMTGGLKRIERAAGVGRPSELAGLAGADAVTLWRMANEGEPDALPTLIRYNAEDVASLPRLARLGIERLSRNLPVGPARTPDFPQFSAGDLPYDAGLVRHITRGR
jgi:uncharacterized protein YprB with RNaseH-like and TPR domain